MSTRKATVKLLTKGPRGPNRCDIVVMGEDDDDESRILLHVRDIDAHGIGTVVVRLSLSLDEAGNLATRILAALAQAV